MPAVADVVRRAVPGIRRRTRNGIFELLVRATTILAARGVRPSIRFALNELFLVRGVRRYTLRRSGRRLFVRHPVFDAWAVHEVINGGVYLPPPQVQELLSRVAAPKIVDLGAHIGSATLLLLERFPTAHVVAVEPQPETAELLRRTIADNGLGASCEILQAAAGVAPGKATMAGFSLLAHFVRADTDEAVDLLPPLRKYQGAADGHVVVDVIDVIPVLAGADLVKMDIEGAEWAILEDPRFPSLGISALVLEFHPQGAPQADTLAAVRTVLGAAGFTVGAPVELHGSVGVVWAWRDGSPRASR